MTQGLGELDRLISDLDQVPQKAARGIGQVLKRGGVEMKKKMAADLRGSSSFRHAARTVDYDYNAASAFGGGHFEVEVGPNPGHPSAPVNSQTGRNAAGLAGLAYYGGSRGGGGTVKEPDYILEGEADTAADYISKLLGDLL